MIFWNLLQQLYDQCKNQDGDFWGGLNEFAAWYPKSCACLHNNEESAHIISPAMLKLSNNFIPE